MLSLTCRNGLFRSFLQPAGLFTKLLQLALIWFSATNTSYFRNIQ